MYWNKKLLEIWRVDDGWIVTLDVLKSATLVLKAAIAVSWIVTLDVLKWSQPCSSASFIQVE